MNTPETELLPSLSLHAEKKDTYIGQLLVPADALEKNIELAEIDQDRRYLFPLP